jgi:hypothetical protein
VWVVVRLGKGRAQALTVRRGRVYTSMVEARERPMFVRRLSAWFSHLAASVTVRLRRPAASSALRQPVLTGAVSYDHDQRTFSIGSASGRWLDDARRLRPHIVSPLHEAQRWSGKPSASASGPSAGAGLPERAPQLPSRPMPPLPASMPPTMPPTMPPLPESAARNQPLPPRASEPVVPRAPDPADPPAASRPAGPSSVEPDQQLQRRLRSLRFLVRHGVYNEGFAPGATPTQYHYSLGLDDAESELSE